VEKKMQDRQFFKTHQSGQSGEGSSGVKLTANSVSTTSGLPCTFEGGMKAIGNGCAAGLFSPNPPQGCVTQALQASAFHTAGCLKLETGDSMKKSVKK
jgi:hypothetical protein